MEKKKHCDGCDCQIFDDAGFVVRYCSMEDYKIAKKGKWQQREFCIDCFNKLHRATGVFFNEFV